MTTFLKVRVSNNWGMDSTYIGKELLGTDLAYVVDVRWPDGTIERSLPIKWKSRMVEMPDMGHLYRCTSYTAIVEVNYRGLKFDVPLEKFKARLSVKKGKAKKTVKGKR